MKDLGHVHYKYLKHTVTGSLFFILVKNQLDLCDFDSLHGFRTQDLNFILGKLTNLKGIVGNGPKETSLEDFGFLIRHLKSFIEYDSNKEFTLSKGLYVGFLKLQSNIDSVKVMVDYSIPNILPCQKIRNNPNISKWFLILNFPYLSEKLRFIFKSFNVLSIVKRGMAPTEIG